MNVGGSAASIERFQAAILAAKKRSTVAQMSVETESVKKKDKISLLQETIKKAKMTKPAAVGGSAFNKLYGLDSRVKTTASTPKLGMQFDVYA